MPASAYSRGDELIGITTPGRVRRTFRSGDLREACSMIFEPSNDPAITAGAQVVVPVKVNTATQASADFSSGGVTTMRVTSRDYGAFANQVSVGIAAGSSTGKLVTLQFEDVIEPFDNVGGTNLLTIEYEPPVSGGWEQMRLQVLSSGVRAVGTFDNVGLNTTVAPGTMPVRGSSGNVANEGKQLTVYGLSASNQLLIETQTLAATPVQFTSAFASVIGARLSSAAAVASVTVVDSAGTPLTLATITAGSSTSSGVLPMNAFFVANEKLLLSADGTTSAYVGLIGKNAVGAAQNELVQLANTAGVLTTGSWSGIDFVLLGNVAAARTVTIQGTAVATNNSVHKTVQKIADVFNAKKSGAFGFVANLVTTQTAFESANLDLTTGTGANCHNTAYGVRADLYAVTSAISSLSSLATASRTAFAPKTYTASFAAANSTTYTLTINSQTVSFASGGSGTTIATVQAGLEAAVAAHPVLWSYARISAGAGSTVSVQIYTPDDFAVSAGTNTTVVLAQAVSGAGQVPGDTTSGSPVFLSGGSEGTTTSSDWQHALDLLKQRRVNTVVVLSGDPSVHAAVEAHCEYMCGIGRSERDACIGLSALDGNDEPLNTLPSLTSIKSQIANLNSRHIRAFAQSIDRYNTSGERETYLPWFTAVLAAGMQAGSTVGTSLTHKYLNVIGHAQSTTWNPVENGEELILSGLCFLEEVPSIGRRIVRNVTTHLSTSNIAYTEASVNEAVNYAVYELRSELESMVGRRGTLSNVNVLKSIASNKLTQLLNEGIIVNWRALAITLNVDVMEVSVEIAPVIPINFIRSTIYLNTIPQVAT